MSSAGPVKMIKNSRGIVLPSVLWITVLAIAITVNYATDVHLNTRVVDNIRTAMVLKYDATSAIYIALERALAIPVAEKSVYKLSVNESTVDIEVKPENMKTDLNTADSDQLQRSFIDAGLSAESANILTDRVIDWRDRNNVRERFGMEDADYFANGSNYGAKDGRFEDLSELLLLAEIDPATFQRMSDYFTTYEKRTGSLYTLTARASKPAQRMYYQISTVVQLTFQSNRPYRILKWQFNNS